MTSKSGRDFYSTDASKCLHAVGSAFPVWLIAGNDSHQFHFSYKSSWISTLSTCPYGFCCRILIFVDSWRSLLFTFLRLFMNYSFISLLKFFVVFIISLVARRCNSLLMSRLSWIGSSFCLILFTWSWRISPKSRLFRCSIKSFEFSFLLRYFDWNKEDE